MRAPALLLIGGLSVSAACGASKAPAAPEPVTTTASTPQPTSTGLHFTVSPIDLNSLIYITSIGAMAPWGHTLPTDHAYFYHHEGTDAYTPIPVFAPGAGTIERINNGRIDVRADSVYSYYIGPLVLADGVAVGVTVQAGTLLGTHGIAPAFDFSVLKNTLHLSFVNPLRYSNDTLWADGPMQYFEGPIRSAILAKVLRSGGQIDGKIDYDVAGTLSGNWYAEDLAVSESGRGGEMYYGVRKLAFARDVFSPDQPRVSIGGLGMTGLFATEPGAPEFASVTAASGLMVYRMMLVGAPQGPPTNLQGGWLLVQLLDASRLRIEAVPLAFASSIANAGPAPTAFSANAEIYLR